MKNLKLLFILSLITLLTGCAAIGTEVSHHNLQTQTLMSDSIFLPPNAANTYKTVFVEVHNTTDKADFNIETDLKNALIRKGFAIVNNPRQAYFVMQINLLQVGRNSETAAKEMMGAGYGGPLEGAIIGGAIAYAASGGVVVGGLAGSAVTSVTDNLVQNVTYSGIVDMKLTLNNAQQKTYQTRILTLSNRVNLQFEEAEPSIKKGLVNSISGVLG